MKETLVYNGEKPLYFVCNHCGYFAKENTKISYQSNINLNIDISAICPNCNTIMNTTENEQMAESLKRFADSNILITGFREGPIYGVLQFDSIIRDTINGEYTEKEIPYIKEVYENGVNVELYEDEYIISCKELNNSISKQSWYDKIEEISKII